MSDFLRSPHPVAVLVVGVLMVLPVNNAMGLLTDDPASEVVENLLEPPEDGEIWLLGNSIFKTGVDPELLHELLPAQPTGLEYHGGHYSSLWYLIARNAMPELATHPGIVVWGFRPGFALLPAARQNLINDTELFVVEGDPVYDRLSSGIALDDRPLDELGRHIEDAVARTDLFQARSAAQSRLADAGLRIGVELGKLVGASGATLVEDAVIRGDSSLLDVLNTQLNGGREQLAEERVDDAVGDFILGDPAAFNDGFIPLTAEQIRALGLDQLVIIWPPRLVAEGTPDPEQDRFVADALTYFEQEGIPVLDLYTEASIGIELYASGDHFTVEGRDVVTRKVADALRDLGFS